MFTYAAFIEELGPLVEQAQALRNRPHRREDDEFRRWRHELTDLISRIEARKYRINCNVVYRNFDERGSYAYTPSRDERMAAYNRDLDDTTTDLETLISHFRKHGDPKAEPAPAAAVAPVLEPEHSPKLLPPEKVTPAWLWQHATVTLWLQAIGLLIVAFSAGVAIGQSALYSELTRKLSPTSTQVSIPQPAPAASKR